ncbi:7818_t:CDS:2, partial [Scutellospora calospora]
MSLPTLRKELEKEFKKLWNIGPLPPFKFDIENIIKDFLLLTLFVGNDFIPPLNNIKSQELGDIISIYNKVLKNCDGYIIDNGKLNLKRLKMIFKNLNISETKSIYNYGNQNREILIKSYIEGLQWVISYYDGTLISYRWFYPGHYSPIISDLKMFEIKNFDNEAYYKSFEHLMFVLPPTSKELLPRAYQNLMNNSEIKEFYPNITNRLNINNLPFIDEKKLLPLLEC